MPETEGDQTSAPVLIDAGVFIGRCSQETRGIQRRVRTRSSASSLICTRNQTVADFCAAIASAESLRTHGEPLRCTLEPSFQVSCDFGCR